MAKIGFIGAGNMAKAIIKGLISAKLYRSEEILVYNHRYAPTLKNLENELAITPVLQLDEVCQQTDMLVLAVKPFVFPTLLEKLAPLIQDQLILSIASGVTIQQMEAKLGKKKILRIMPNTPALVGEGMSSISPNQQVLPAETQRVKALFQSIGKAEILPEKMIPAVIGASGSSPAFVYLFIEALADGAVAEGMPRELAYEFAAQAVLGSAKMVLETKAHPGVLKDMVTSPGGTTITALQSLENNRFRGAVIDAVRQAAQKDRELGSKDN